MRRILGIGSFVFFAAVNPSYLLGCGADEPEPEYTFGEADMQGMLAALNAEGVWALPRANSDYRVELHLEQRVSPDAEMARDSAQTSAFGARAHACGEVTRMFGQTASACSTIYRSMLPITGSLTLLRMQDDRVSTIAEDVAVEGDLEVWGIRLDNGQLWLRFDGGELALESWDGESFEVTRFAGLGLAPDP